MDYSQEAVHNLSTPATIALASAGALLGGATLANTMGIFGKNHMPVEGRTILLTGATEGMGRSAARQLSEQGASIVIVARNVPRLEEALAEIKAAAKSPEKQRFHYISADVSQPDYATQVVAAVSDWNGGQAPDIVWCVAGMSTPVLWADCTDAMPLTRRNMDVNFWGSAEMAHAIMRAWWYPSSTSATTTKWDEPKHLIFTSSVIAFYGIVGYGPYTPSKWALRGLADTLVQESLLYPDQPVKVHVVVPGTILSPGFEREQLTKPELTKMLEKDDPRQTPDEVASKAIRGLQRGQYFVTVSFLGEMMRFGVMGGSLRNNWVLDTLGAWIMAVVWYFVLWIMHGDIKGYARKHGRPGLEPKKT